MRLALVKQLTIGRGMSDDGIATDCADPDATGSADCIALLKPLDRCVVTPTAAVPPAALGDVSIDTIGRDTDM